MANTELLARIDAAIAEKSLLKHPFYQGWQAGKLSREALQLYAAQYYRHVQAFPKHLRVLAARTEGPLQGLIRENLARSEEHTSELQSQSNLVCRLLLEKKKKTTRGFRLLVRSIPSRAGRVVYGSASHAH